MACPPPPLPDPPLDPPLSQLPQRPTRPEPVAAFDDEIQAVDRGQCGDEGLQASHRASRGPGVPSTSGGAGDDGGGGPDGRMLRAAAASSRAAVSRVDQGPPPVRYEAGVLPPAELSLVSSKVGKVGSGAYASIAWGGDGVRTASGPILGWNPRASAIVSPEQSALIMSSRLVRTRAASSSSAWIPAFARSLRVIAILFLVRPSPLRSPYGLTLSPFLSLAPERDDGGDTAREGVGDLNARPLRGS